MAQMNEERLVAILAYHTRFDDLLYYAVPAVVDPNYYRGGEPVSMQIVRAKLGAAGYGRARLEADLDRLVECALGFWTDPEIRAFVERFRALKKYYWNMMIGVTSPRPSFADEDHEQLTLDMMSVAESLGNRDLEVAAAKHKLKRARGSEGPAPKRRGRADVEAAKPAANPAPAPAPAPAANPGPSTSGPDGLPDARPLSNHDANVFIHNLRDLGFTSKALAALERFLKRPVKQGEEIDFFSMDRGFLGRLRAVWSRERAEARTVKV